MARPASPLITVQAVAETALRLIDEHGDFSLPKLAAALGVRQSSIYNHVPGREAIIELVRHEVLRGGPLPQTRGMSWQEALRRLVEAYWQAFRRHPNVVPLLVRQTVTSPAVLDYYERIVVVLNWAGVPAPEQLHVISAIDHLVLGSVLDLGAPAQAWDASGPGHPTLLRALRATGDPGHRAEAAFELGLDLLVRGLAQRL